MPPKRKGKSPKGGKRRSSQGSMYDIDSGQDAAEPINPNLAGLQDHNSLKQNHKQELMQNKNFIKQKEEALKKSKLNLENLKNGTLAIENDNDPSVTQLNQETSIKKDKRKGSPNSPPRSPQRQASSRNVSPKSPKKNDSPRDSVTDVTKVQ